MSIFPPFSIKFVKFIMKVTGYSIYYLIPQELNFLFLGWDSVIYAMLRIIRNKTITSKFTCPVKVEIIFPKFNF